MSVAARIVSAIVLAACVAGVRAAQPESPEAQVASFLARYRALKFSGLPDPRQAKALSPYLSTGLNDRMRKARAAQRSFAARHKDEKPPMIEGDLFSSLFEGPTSFDTGESRVEAGRATVVVRFSYADGRSKIDWTDQYELVRKPNGDGWVVDDVRYLGNWPFASKGRLSEGLEEVAALKP